MTEEEFMISKSIYEASGKSASAEFYETETVSPELAAAQARIKFLEAALAQIVANDDKWQALPDEKKSSVQWWHQGSLARVALGIKERGLKGL